MIRTSPPDLSVALTWRELYGLGAFAQRELTSPTQLSQIARERGVRISIGSKPLEAYDLAGAFSPVAFSGDAYISGVELPAVSEDILTFREETEPTAWENFSWDTWGFPEVSPLYSPWQALYLDDVATGRYAEVPLETLVLSSEDREKALTSVESRYQSQRAIWIGLDRAWRPLVKVLVYLQNRYWPQVSGRVSLLPSTEEGVDWVEAGRAEMLEPVSMLATLGLSEEDLRSAYHFLLERGLDREPQDGLLMLRRARPRAFHKRWRGSARRAQDNLDAAEMIRLFLVDLSGRSVPPPEGVLLDGRQPERAALYQYGPAAPLGDDEIKKALIEAQVYPHGVEAIVEGESEQVLVDTIVTEFIGPLGALGVNYFDLGGAGAANQVKPLVSSFGAYALSTVVIVDAEGKMGEYVKRAIKDGDIAEEDVCLAKTSLEEDNSSPEELIELLEKIAANPPDGIEPAEVDVTADQLLDKHTDRLSRAPKGGEPGLADTLLKMAEGMASPVRVPKAQLAEALARRMVEEYGKARGDEEKVKALFERRPVLEFVIKRIIKPLNPPRPL